MSFWTAQNQLHAMQALMQGARLSAIGAAGLVSRWVNVEAAQGPTAVNPSSGAFGIAQWLGSRKARIYPNTNFDAQLNFAVSELNGTEARAGNVLRAANSPDEAARGASMYERAEGYNASTGRDNWTNRTAAGIPSVYALLSNQSVPQNVAQSGGGDYIDSAIPIPGNETVKIAVIAAAGVGLLWFLYNR